MRITTVRILVQIACFGLFLAFCLLTTFRFVDEHHGQFWISKFLEIDPLVGIATAITTGTVYKGLAWGLLLLVPTLLLGRIFCNWICPYGILHQFVGWVFNSRAAKERIESNRYQRLYSLKYAILIAMFVALFGQMSLALFVAGTIMGVVCGLVALLIAVAARKHPARRLMFAAVAVAWLAGTGYGAHRLTRGDWNGTLQIGLLDPICLLHRSFTAAVLPALNMPAAVQEGVPGVVGGAGDFKQHIGAWLVGFVLVTLVAANLYIPRFFCRVLCPLGATLGFLSRFALWRIERDPAKCTDCDLCLTSCEGASDPHTQLRKSECFVCFNCIEDCPHDAISFKFVPERRHEIAAPDIRRARASSRRSSASCSILAGGREIDQGFLGRQHGPSAGLVRRTRPSWSRCIKCDQCIRVCPTNVLQPYPFDLQNIEALWTPVMNFRMGFCQLHCTACGEVCPTGAIQRIGVERKLGLGQHAASGPVVLGTAHYDLGRCLPWSMKKPCVVCEEVCPTSPKAIYTERMKFVERDGKKVVLSATGSTVTVGGLPRPGEFEPQPTIFSPNQFRGDGTTTYHVEVVHRNGVREMHPVRRNDADTLEIDGQFDQPPAPGEFAVVMYEWSVPKIDTNYCIGCGICEHECPVVGDRRAVYVTAEGESRSSREPQRERNRGLSLIKTADAGGSRRSALVSLTGLIASGDPNLAGTHDRRGAPPRGGCGSKPSGGCCGGSSGGCGCSDKPAAPARTATGHVVDLRKFLT
ncbi:MAG: 4Fe-4S dicluster domain-containing protein [Phycisphaerae bacterium]